MQQEQGDKTRIEGSDDDYIIYKLPKSIASVQVDAFFTTPDRDMSLIFLSGITGQTLAPIFGRREIFESSKMIIECTARFGIR